VIKNVLHMAAVYVLLLQHQALGVFPLVTDKM